ncbi:MAG: O-methyltransferase [Bacteroidota bacterium]
MHFLPEEIEKYACEHTAAEPELLKKINRETHLQVLMPRMLSGHFQGRFLSMISKMINPGRILEIGTYTGYSALCFCEGLSKNGKLITIDNNEELEERVRGYFAESEYNNRIEYIKGNAMEVIPQLTGDFDIVFIDADKENYLNYYHLVFDKVKPGGYIIADNVLWSGKVLQPYEKLDKDTQTLVEYSNFVYNDKRVEPILLPVRDGLMVARKK